VTHLAIVFPGASYGHRQPGLRLPTMVLESRGALVVAASYRSTTEDEPFYAGVDATYDEALAEHRPSRITLVGKSLGGHALAHLARRGVRADEAVWLTPVLERDEVFAGASAAPWPSLWIYGTADSAHHPARQAHLPGEHLQLDGADHVLEVEGDPSATVDCWRRIVVAVSGLLEQR